MSLFLGDRSVHRQLEVL